MSIFAASPLGFVGLGIMGKGMVKNLASKLDSKLVIWNRSEEVSREFKSAFPEKITIAATAKEVVQMCDVTFCMLSTLEASMAVFDSDDGVIAGVTSGKIVVDCATLTPERIIDEANRISAKGGKMLEAPVSGSKVPADQGQLIFLCGGDEAVYNDLLPALNSMGKASFFLGPVGQGTRMKLVVNMVMGSMMGAFAEGISLCEATGLPAEELLKVLDLGAMSNPMFRGKGPGMINRKYDTNFPLKHAEKDMRFAMALATEFNTSVPVAAKADEMYASVLTKHGEDDFAAVVEAFRTSKKEGDSSL